MVGEGEFSANGYTLPCRK